MTARRRWLLTALCAFVAVYLIAALGLYSAMRQPPEKFGAIMKHVPTAAMMVLPFPPLWNAARAGSLGPGDMAPDFTLPLLDHSRTVRLAEEYKERPVILIFGSYT